MKFTRVGAAQCELIVYILYIKCCTKTLSKQNEKFRFEQSKKFLFL